MEFLIIFAARYLFLLSVAIFIGVFILITRPEKRYFIKLSLLTSIVSFALAKIASMTYYNPRPFVVERVSPLVAHGADNGFPSDHTLLTITIAVIIFQFNKKLGIFLAIIAVLVGSARVLARVHHPIDIFGSVIVAILAIKIVVYIFKKIAARNSPLT